MKTNIIANNTVINTIMRTYLKYICAILLVIGTSAHTWGQAPSLTIEEKVNIDASDFTGYYSPGANTASVGVVSVTTTSCYKNTCSSSPYIRLTSGSTMTVSTSDGVITQVHFSPMTTAGCSGNGMDGKFSANSGSISQVTWTNASGVSSVIFTATSTADFRNFTVTIQHTSVTCPFTFPTSISMTVASGDVEEETVNITGTTGYSVQTAGLSNYDLGGGSDDSELSNYYGIPTTISVLGEVPGTYYGTFDVAYQRLTPYSYYEIHIPITVTVTGCADISGQTVTVNTVPAPTYNCSTEKWETTVSWNAVPGASRYGLQLQVYDGGWTNSGAAVYVYAPKTSYTYTNLTSGNRYRIGVAAQNQSCVPNTNTSSTASSEFNTTCPAITDLGASLSGVLSTSANMSWSATPGVCTTTYSVWVSPNSDYSSPVWTQTTSTNTSHSLTGLSSNTKYYVKITAYNECGNSQTRTGNFTTAKALEDYRYTCIEMDLDPTDGTTNPLLITSAGGQKVKAIRTLTLSVTGSTANANKDVTLTGENLLFYKTDGTQITGSVLQTNASGVLAATEIVVAYNPTAYVDETWATPVITVSCDGNNIGFDNLVHGRCLPDNFVIASKLGEHWYALTANCSSSDTYTGVLINVDSESDPNSAIAPIDMKWGMREVASTRYAANGMRMTFTEHITATAEDSRKVLYNYNSTSLGLNSAWSSYKNATSPDRHEWIPETTNKKDYTLTSPVQLSGESKARTISLKTDGVFGTLVSAKSYEGQVRLLPATFVDPADMQVVEWKSNKVVVMYTGSGVTATTKVGSNAESSAQTLTAKKIDHGVFELATDQTLTSNADKLLTITIRNGSSAVVGTKILTIPAIVSGAKNADALGFTTAQASNVDVIVLDEATLSAVATKYTYNNITVYPGGKLVIGSGKQLGMASLTLRGGSSWGATPYQYKYPQFVVNNTTSGAYSNSAGVINYDYVTTKSQFYSFVLPYASNTNTIKYPVDIYGSNVAANNKGSFEFQYYDGDARAAGGTGWATLAEDPTEGAALVAGRGYTFLGMPKKVDAYDGTDDSHATSRQNYGIHRIPMSVSATNVQNGETGTPSDKAIPISVTLADKNNNSGWVLVGNPYLSNVSGLSNSDIQVGQLVPVNDAGGNWTGRWEWDNPSTGQRFLVIPGNDGTTFESVQASTATLPAFKNFFAQISNSSATSMVIPAANRSDKLLAPRRFAENDEQDIQLAVDLVSETRSDKVDLLINDIYTSDFDLDGDFTKMMNSTKLNIYGVYPGDNLSFIAVDKTTAASSIGIGYQVPEGGDYTLQLSDKPYVMSEYIDALYVTDHEVEPNITTDLLDKPYVFHVNDAETNNTRFTLSIVLKKEIDTPTKADVVNDGGDVNADKAQKFIWRDKMYIYYQGVIYDSTGKKVSEINK